LLVIILFKLLELCTDFTYCHKWAKQ